jgi:branched-chain amino acid transport system permease protein
VSNIDSSISGHGAAVTRNRTAVTAVRTARDDMVPLVLIVAGIGLLIFLLQNDLFSLSVLVLTLLYAGLASSWNIIGGLGGQFSIAHSVFFAIGAYVAGNLFLHWNVSPWIALLPAAALAASLAMLVSWPVFRLRGPFFAIATMALTEVAIAVAHYAEPVTGGASGLTIPYRSGLSTMIFREKWVYGVLFLGYLTVTLVASILVTRSRLGYYLQAVRDNESSAMASGVNVLRTKVVGMGLSAALTAMGGVLFMMYVRVVDPESLLSLFDVGVKIVLIALIGGMGKIWGPLLGAALIVPLDFWLRATIGTSVPGGSQIALGVILILAALFLKTGIHGGLEKLWSRARRASS